MKNLKQSVLQFSKFSIVGLTGIPVDLTTTYLITEHLMLDPRLSAVFGFLAAVSTNYILNKLWTFKLNKNMAKPLSSYLLFVLICSLGAAISIGSMHFFMEFYNLKQGKLYLIARLLGILLAAIWNYTGSKIFVFKSNEN